jgi:phosphoenolpyruvate-protein phosphotransferase (PTS system enzyme I)
MKNKETHKNLMFKGIAASPGVVIGQVSVISSDEFNIVKKAIKENEIPKEINRFQDALIKTREEILIIKEDIQKSLDIKQAEIFNAHLLILEDRVMIEDIIKRVKAEKINIEYVFFQVLQKFIETFQAVDDLYIRERVSDIKDIGKRILRNLMGEENFLAVSLKEKDLIIAADDIAPSDTALMHKEKVLGFITDVGSRTSHTAIMARSLEIPAVVGLKNITKFVENGNIIIVDGSEGCVIVDPDEKTIGNYRKKITKIKGVNKELEKLKDLPAVTIDDVKVGLLANIEFAEDVESALFHGANGVGLYRTEFFYMNRMDLPTEEEHFNSYKLVAEKMKPNRVVIRTLDLGGDKFLSHLDIPQEMNPFLGWRAIRFCLEKIDIFKIQLRAILRASVYGNIAIMYPMISGIEEFRKANKVVEEVKQSLKDSGIAYDENIKIGVMIEIPSAAMIADILAKEADFFSIGTNDLIQYSLAVDRGNEKIAYLYEPTHLAILRLLKMIIDAGHKENIPVAMCGEMSSEALYTVLLIGLGLDEFSVSSVILPEIKNVIRLISKKEAQKIAQEALSFTTGKEIDEFLKKKLKKILPEKI